jgi:hypothetical protein
MTDRDHFAAAALTCGMGVLGYEQIVKSCYEMADAMLREREKPIACDTKKPVAWIAFATDGSESSAVYLMQEQAQAAADEWGWSIAPLYCQTQWANG